MDHPANYYLERKLFLCHQDTFTCKQEHYEGLGISSKLSSLWCWVLALLLPYLAWRHLSDVIVNLYILWSLGSNALPEKSQASFWRVKHSSEHWTPFTWYIIWLCQLCIMWLQDGVHSGIRTRSQHEKQTTVTLNLLQKHWGWWADLASRHLIWHLIE